MARLPAAVSPTVEAVYAAYERGQGDGYRTHLGASLIGHECDRNIWLTWRWTTRSAHGGRLLRLFDTGNLAEARFVADLRRVGVQVLEVNPETGRQWEFRDASGHFGGSMDGAGIGLVEARTVWHGLEFKTHSSKSFQKLVADGVQKSKPQHYDQMQAYMALGAPDRFFYFAVNKDTDELYGERVKPDAAHGMRLLAKAARLIAAETPPGRISEDAAWWVCRMCSHHAACHEAALPERHCRSCLFAEVLPTDGGWRCGKHGVALSTEMQRSGCGSHRYNPGLVHGQQTDAGEGWVEYRLADGSSWRDGGP
jgi:hypothetical protein